MNEKVYIVLSGIAAVSLLVLALYFFFFTPNVVEPPQPVTTFPEPPPASDYQASLNNTPTQTPLIATDSGIALPATNLLSAPAVYELDEEVYIIVEELPERGDQYKIVYNEFDGSIFVSLLSEPLATARQAAENDLLQYSGLSPAQLCTARVIVNTTLAVSQQFSGRNLGLSFCENSVVLE